eukprot:XP_001706341.1 Hypothetical protein GL50803_13651 [Giardia lamblia ATCC 50803]
MSCVAHLSCVAGLEAKFKKAMNSEQRLLSWIETDLKPRASTTSRSLLKVYLSSSVLMSNLLRHLYNIDVTGAAVLPTLLRTLMPGEKSITIDDVFAREELFEDAVSLLNQRILRKTQTGRSPDETSQENVYHTLAAFDSCQQRKDALLEALEVVEADIYAQQRELKNAVQAMSSEIADLLLKCDTSKKATKQRQTVTFADSKDKTRSIVNETDGYYEEIEELTIDELSSPSASYSGAAQGPLTTTDDKRIAQLQDNIQRITSVLKAYNEQQEERGRYVGDANAHIRVLTETREENRRYQVLVNNLSDEVSVYKGKLSDLSRECDVLKSKLASSRPDFSQSSITTTEKSSPAALQSATPGRTYIRTPDNAKAPRPGSRPRAMSQKSNDLRSSLHQRRGGHVTDNSYCQPQPSTPTLSATTKINELKLALKQRESTIMELRAQISELTRASSLSVTDFRELEEKHKSLMVKCDKLRTMLRSIEQRIREYAVEDSNLTCNPTGRDALELLSSFYHLMRDKCYDFARKAVEASSTKIQKEKTSQDRRFSETFDKSFGGGGRGHSASYLHGTSSVERENERLRAVVQELSSGKDAFERRLSQLEGQINQQNKRADETRRDPLLTSSGLMRSTRLDRSIRTSSRGRDYGDRFRRSSNSEYEYSGDYDDISLNNLAYRLRSDSKRIAMLTGDAKRPGSSRRY